MKKIILILSFLILSSSCNFSSTKIDEVPAWYVSPSQNSDINLYGVGDGFTIEEATKSALNNLSSKISISISSSSSSIIEENKYDFSEQYISKINQTIQEIDLSNYKITKSASVNSRIFYIEVAIDKTNFIKRQKRYLEKNHQEIQSVHDSSKNKNIIAKINNFLLIKSLIKSSNNFNNILYSLGVNSEHQGNLKKYQLFYNYYDKILESLEFFVDSDNKRIKDSIIKALNDKNIKIAVKNNGEKNLVIIKVETTSNIKKIFNSNIAKIRVNVNILHPYSKIIASNSIEVSGSSVLSEKDALNRAINRFSNILINKDILKFMGIEKQ